MIVDLDKAVELVDKVIADAAKDGVHKYERPEQDSGCFYVHRFREDGGFLDMDHGDEIDKREPGCIVGRVAIELGVPMERIEFSDEGYFSLEGGIGYKMKDEFGITFTDEAHVFLRRTQYRQDMGCDWVTARHEALNYVRERL